MDRLGTGENSGSPGSSAQAAPQNLGPPRRQDDWQAGNHNTTQDDESRSTYTTTTATNSPLPTPQSPSESGEMPEGKNEREVTDPVTHQPIMIHDLTSSHMDKLSLHSRTSSLKSSRSSSRSAGPKETEVMQALLEEEMMRQRWRDAVEDGMKKKITITSAAISAGGAAGAMFAGLLWAMAVAQRGGGAFTWFDMGVGVIGCLLLGIGVGGVVYFTVGGNMTSGSDTESKEKESRENSFDRKTVPRLDFTHQLQSQDPESAAWLNSFLSAVWPIVDPGLFTSLADTLEDVMQASLPKLIRGVRVADIGQGSEPVRLLGVRYLTAGDATIGNEIEEGDYVALELSMAYRARKNSGGLKGRSRNAHLLMEFFSVGGLRLPVWVELTGFLATARVRLQLTPNPPFLSLMTLTFLGKPKVTLSCVPVAKNFLNVMDIPGISNFIQSSIDEAMAQYVAPRSLTLDLGEMLVGPDWKTDTEAEGVLIVRIKRANSFKDGDGGKFWLSTNGKSGDPYVTVGWGKWGKALWATRIIENEPHPMWDETTMVLVGPAELNAKERLRLQLYDSDRTTADDILGIIQVPLEDLMKQSETDNRMQAREDRFSDDNGQPLPGSLQWEVGYFTKTRLEHYVSQEELDRITRECGEATEKKLREAEGRREETGELDQQKRDELKARTNEIISARRPHDDWPSGILTIQIHNIIALEVENVNKSGVKETEDEEEGDDLPSSYCSVILNEQKVYRTRTKLKTNKPFFNATTERFIRDWRSTSVTVAVRDSRLHENDPLIGLVHLPLQQLFHSSASVTDFYPLMGGVGFGRVRLTLLFRSVVSRLPRESLGWEVGTLEVFPNARASNDLPKDLSTCRLVVTTTCSRRKGKLLATSEAQHEWKNRRNRSIHFPIKNHYCSMILIRFRKYSLGPDQTAAFASLWLKDIPDDEDVPVTVQVYRNKGDALTRARGNATKEISQDVAGTLTFKVKFWRGVSPYHMELAQKDQNMKDVIETKEAMAADHENDEFGDDFSSSSSSESESDAEEDQKLRNEGKRGVVDTAREYKRNHKEIHRKHRGLMQWKGMRTISWIKDGIEEKGEKAGEKVRGTFKHQGRESRVEKEV